MKNNEILKVYAYAQTIFTNFTVPTNELQAQLTNITWIKFLKPYPLEIIYSAIDQYAKENKFINIVQIAEMCREALEISQGTHQTTETYINELERAVSKSGSVDGAINAYNSLSEILKSIVPGYWYLGRWHNEGFEFVATRLKEEIKNKLREASFQTYIQANSKLLLSQAQKNETLRIEGEN